MISCWRDFRLTYTARGKAWADVRGSVTTFLWHLFLCEAMLGSKAAIRHIKHFLCNSLQCKMWVDLTKHFCGYERALGAATLRGPALHWGLIYTIEGSDTACALSNISVQGNVRSWTKTVVSMPILLTALFNPREYRCETSHYCNMKMTLAKLYWRSHL